VTRPNSSPRRGGDQQGSFYPFQSLNPFSPPDTKTLVYSPDVRIIIARGNKQYDVSKDVINGTIIRKENSASTLLFSLANKGDYNGLFHRMDRVVVFLKRIQWQQVFSGYLDTVPFAQLYGGTANYKATCTLKRLMHTWWTPTLTESLNIFNQSIFSLASTTEGDEKSDSGLGSVLRELLVRVGGWQPQDIYIQNFPMVFFEFLQSQLLQKREANQSAGDNFRKLLLGKSWNQAAPGAFAGYSNEAGPPGPAGVGEAHYIEQIVAACDDLGLGPLTTEVASSRQLADAANVGQQARDESVKDSFTQVGASATAQNQAALNSDAAILGVACAMVETGGGVTIRNLANLTVPESLKSPYDGIGRDHDSVGIFQQRSIGWGLVGQRMNPRQAATMFFNRLPPDWRNLPPGDAIQRTQQSAFPAKYALAIPLATQKVQALRKAKEGAASTVAGTPLGAAATAAGAPIGLNPATVADAVKTSPSPVADINSALNKPNPDNEGAVQEAIRQLGKFYIWGDRGPNTFDCSGFVQWSFRAIGKEVGYTTYDMQTLPRIDESAMQRGDILITNGGEHVVLNLGDGTVIEASGQGGATTTPTPGQQVVISSLASVGPIKSVHRVGANGGPNPLAPRLDPLTSGPGSPVGTGDSYSGGAGGGQAEEPIARNLFAWAFDPGRFASATSEMYTEDHKDFMEAEPLMSMVQAVAGARLCNFASAPDGSFMAYYPDHFGLDGKKAIVVLEDIELKDVKINFSDDNLTTHVYVAGDHSYLGMEANVNPLAWLESAGSVTVEHDWLFQRLQGIAPGDLGGVNGMELMRRFGVRPLKVPVAMAGSQNLEFLLACQYFMQKWAAQYETSASFTFLPELFPGMRVILSGHNLQVYVSEVTHTFDWENGFSTQAVIMAPSRTDAASAMVGTSGVFGPDDTNINAGLGGFDISGTYSGGVVP
jgi:cell wall-associated NlpC family hydrolase